MKKLLLTIIGSAFTALTANAVQLGEKLLLTARLTGDQEVPGVATPAIGVASFLLNGKQDSLCVDVTYTALSSAITGAHIHAAGPGVNGPVIKDLSTFIKGNTIKTVIYGNDLTAHLKEFLSGQLYINVHTTNHTDGEIRGQIHLETDWSFPAWIDGSQLVPSTTTTAYGLGVFNLSKDSSKIRFNIITTGTSGPLTEARLNYGPKGLNGAVAVSLTSFISGNNVSGIITNPSKALIDSLVAGKVYVDFSTATHTNGTELRGQLWTDKQFLFFDAALNGQQEVPAVLTTGGAVASLRLNAALDTLYYDVVANGLTGAITQAHFHFGPPGVSGGVEVDIMPALQANGFHGKIYGGALTKLLIGKFLTGNIYLNLHTAINPNGEIRGQVYRVARQGYIIDLSGAQQVPPVTTPAVGSGIVSIDRNSDNAHFMIVANGLVGSAIHFHKQIAGQNGNPLFDLLPYWANNAAFGFWKSNNTTAFTLAIADAFQSDSIYVNIHTIANPNGEIRGQVIKSGECFKNIITGIEENKGSTGIALYPNPTSDLLNIAFNLDKQSNVSFEIVDVLGKQVYSENFTAQTGNNLRSVFVNKFKNGLYFVKIQIGTTLTIERFVKN